MRRLAALNPRVLWNRFMDWTPEGSELEGAAATLDFAIQVSLLILKVAAACAVAFLLSSIVAGLLSLTARAQERKRPTVQRIDWALLAGNAGVRTYDAVTTRYALTHGKHETILPNAIAGNTVNMALYSAAMIGMDWTVNRMLTRHGHPKLARAFTIIDTAQVGIATWGSISAPRQPRGPRGKP